MALSAPKILFLADCGPEVGGGHVMRCLALAEALVSRGAVCGFATTSQTSRVLDAFAPAGIERLAAPAEPQHALIEAAVDAAEAWGASAVLVDHYGVGARQEALFREVARWVLCLDDMPGRPHDCDLLIDPGLGRLAGTHKGDVPAACQMLAGPEYALLRPEFAQARTAALGGRRPQDAPGRLFVSLGLTDVRGITGRVLNLIRPGLGQLEIDIAIGSDATSLTWLRHLAGQNPRLQLHLDARNMPELMAQADIGIGAGGASTWERASLGLPSLSLVLADNQEGLAHELDRRGAAIAVDSRDKGFAEALPAAFRRLIEEAQTREGLSHTSAALCDGEGAGRAAQAILALLA